ncbi:MAG: hypothetical protein U0236_05275 [Nitrospira sp.]
MRIYLSIMVSVLGLCAGMAYAGPPENPEMKSWGKPLATTRLDTQRGGTDTGPVTINANMLNAKLFNNKATDNVTGNNTIAGGAFAGANGLPIVIQNSGNNVIIQSGTVLNLTMK